MAVNELDTNRSTAEPGRYPTATASMPILRRRIEIATRPGIARGNVADDYHDFRVEVEHRDGIVQTVRGVAVRNPWNLCVAAAPQVRELEGMALSRRSVAVADHVDRFLQCTHVFDLAGQCIAAAARDIEHRLYEIAVPQRIDGRTTASLSRDGRPMLEWTVDGSTIVAPGHHAGVELRAGFSAWADALEEEEAEAAHALRRAIFISGGLGKAWNSESRSRAAGGCYVQQPERAPHATYVADSRQDFTDRADALGTASRAWLAFQD